MKRVLYLLTAALFLATGIATIFESPAMAAYRDGKNFGQCGDNVTFNYFSHTCTSAQIDPVGPQGEIRGYVLPLVFRDGAWQEAMYGVNSVDSLMAYLRANHDSGNERLRAPAAFIVHAMLGRSGGQANANGGKTISAADWVEVDRRLRLPGMTYEWNSLVNASINTGGRTGNDVAFVRRPADTFRQAIVMRHNGTPVFIIQRECANPIGDLPGLPGEPTPPPPGGSMVPILTPSPTDNIYPPQDLQFKFDIQNNTPVYQPPTPFPTEENPNPVPPPPITADSTNYTIKITDGNGNSLGGYPTNGSVSVPRDGGIITVFNFIRASTHAWGGRVCAELSISPANFTATGIGSGSASTGTKCVFIRKKPLLQVLGGDVWAGGGFATVSGTCPNNAANITGVSRQYSNGTRTGSWSEYATFALGDITEFGSAAKPLLTPEGKDLTFSNQGGALGRFYGTSPAEGRCLTDVVAMFKDSGPVKPGNPSTINVSTGIEEAGVYNLTSPTIRVKNSGNSPLIAAKEIFINAPNSTVIIEDSIKFNTNYSRPHDIPRVVIHAKNIIINDNVTRVDAWLSATESLSTCQITGDLTVNQCDEQLLLNGPVIAEKINWRRTFGAGEGTLHSPAEQVNLRPEILLKEFYDSEEGSKARTILQKELPPRY
ncbi:hypothetical protein CYG49_03875 [Candidatus Saccharibacteria bacterium]|nr:MAG: hypothetical protein CYG49_03875 [Candidatus Saccharibacteria bacterium]